MTVVWSNDISEKKARLFEANSSSREEANYIVEDLKLIEHSSMPESVDLAWASFPCTDLSLAGSRGGLNSGASSAYWHFIKSIAAMRDRRPKCIAIENVSGLATSAAGRDLRSIITSLNGLGYSVDILSIDARRFVPQSRPRLFIVGMLGSPADDPSASPLRPAWLSTLFDDPRIRTHRTPLPAPPPLLKEGFSQLAERLRSSDDRWWSGERVDRFTSSLTPAHYQRLISLTKSTIGEYRTAYRRMRQGEPRWEIRPDDIAGCLRTARGGSSRQAVVYGDSRGVKIRWMTPREYAALMGAADYRVGAASDADVYSGFGDAVCVPVVTWLAHNVILPNLQDASARRLEKLIVAS